MSGPTLSIIYLPVTFPGRHQLSFLSQDFDNEGKKGGVDPEYAKECADRLHHYDGETLRCWCGSKDSGLMMQPITPETCSNCSFIRGRQP